MKTNLTWHTSAVSVTAAVLVGLASFFVVRVSFSDDYGPVQRGLYCGGGMGAVNCPECAPVGPPGPQEYFCTVGTGSVCQGPSLDSCQTATGGNSLVQCGVKDHCDGSGGFFDTDNHLVPCGETRDFCVTIYEP